MKKILTLSATCMLLFPTYTAKSAEAWISDATPISVRQEHSTWCFHACVSRLSSFPQAASAAYCLKLKGYTVSMRPPMYYDPCSEGVAATNAGVSVGNISALGAYFGIGTQWAPLTTFFNSVRSPLPKIVIDLNLHAGTGHALLAYAIYDNGSLNYRIEYIDPDSGAHLGRHIELSELFKYIFVC